MARRSYNPALAAAAHRSKVRQFITPEGVDLQLEIASASLRFGALVLDLVLMVMIGAAALFVLGFSGLWSDGSVLVVVMLGFFLLRNFWFIGFELGPRAATPGKRACGIRVVARDGGRLTVAAVVARNMVREIEMFLPFGFIGGLASQDLAGMGTVIFGMLWSLSLSLFLLFNKDRMRLGDLIGGTWVVLAKRRKIAADISTSQFAQTNEGPQFSPEELAVYGVYELQELERVLRRGDQKTQMVVADTIRAKLGRPIVEPDLVFLVAYYKQARARMERDLLFGKRRANKFEEPR